MGIYKKLLLLFNKPRISALIFFLIYLVIGISIYKDYGISWDEPTHRQIAMVNAKYLSSFFMTSFHQSELNSLPALADYSAKQYGVIFDLPLYFAEVLLGYNGNMPEAYYIRHLCAFLLFFVSLVFFYLIIRNRFNSWLLGLTGCLFLILSPRFFAESFYSKDIVFLSLFIISIYFFVRYLHKKSLSNSLLFALASALVTDQRITGLFLPFLAVLFTSLDFVKGEGRFKSLKETVLPLFTYIGSYIFFTFIFWPYLWESPVQNFIDSFTKMNSFPFVPPVLYLGSFISAKELPWHYIPLWILITTPLLYTFFFLLGSAWTIKGVVRNGLRLYTDDKERQDFLFLLLFFVPLFSVITLKSVLYDGWRHMYFIYAPFLLIAMIGVARVGPLIQATRTSRERYAAFAIAAVVIVSLISTSVQMVKYHPFQHVYFNLLAGDKVGQKFELDYWGLSFRRGLDYIVKNDKRPIIKLAANTMPPLLNNLIFVNREDAKRLRLADIQQADYFLTNYRWQPHLQAAVPEVCTITVDNMKILSVFKLR